MKKKTRKMFGFEK